MTFKQTVKRISVAVSACLIAVTLVLQPTTISAASSTSSQTSSSKADRVISIGNQYLGTPYKFGATPNQTKNFDCSSFVQYVYSKVGVNLPRTSYTQATKGKAVKRSQLKKGDLVFFSNGRRGAGKISHVAIYAGNDKILHTYGSPGVTYSKLSSSTWSNMYVTARRVL